MQKFTLDQIEGLIVHNVPDATLSNQIRLHGLAFAPSPAILDELSAKGAGPLTLAAIQAFVSKAPQAQPGAPAKQPGGQGQGGGNQSLVQAQQLAWKAQPANGQIEITQAEWRNGASVTIQSATLECIQYGANNQSLSQLTTTLNGPVQPGQTVNIQPFTLGTEAQGVANMKCGIVGVAPQAQPVATQPTDSEPTLAATMQFIQDKLNERGALKFAVHTHDNADGKDSTDQYINETSNLIVDPTSCNISYHRTHKKNGAVEADADVSFSLHNVQDVVVTTAEQSWKLSYSSAGHPTWDAKIDPPMFQVVVRKAGNQGNGFYFTDEEMANRVAKALRHAVELCGGNREPF
ncbi:MAG: hypothetical protein WBE03_00905 [Terracidiphilus sp.]